MTSVLTSEAPIEQTFEMPCNNAPNQVFQTKPFSTIIGNGGQIYQTLFVDGVNYDPVTPDGSILRPFRTLQNALDHALLHGWGPVQLLIAPGIYADPVNVAFNHNVIFSGWDPTLTNAPLLNGRFHVPGDIAAGPILAFENVVINADRIEVDVPATENLRVVLEHCYCESEIRSLALDLTIKQSTFQGSIASTGDVTIRWDGPSWSYWMSAPTTIPVSTTHLYFDAGHDTFRVQLNASAITVGTTGFTDIAIPYLRGGDRVDVQFEDHTVADALLNVQGSDPAGGSAAIAITNLSRASGTFTDAVLCLIHHDAMVGEPATMPMRMAALDEHSFDADVQRLIDDAAAPDETTQPGI